MYLERTTNEKDAYGDMRIRPTKWLSLEANTRYDMDKKLLREFNTDTRITNGDRWSVGLGTRYLLDDSNLVSVDLSYRLTRRWVAHVIEQVDMQNGQWQEQDYVLRQELHDWFITYGFRHRSQVAGRDETAIYFTFTLKAYPAMNISFN